MALINFNGFDHLQTTNPQTQLQYTPGWVLSGGVSLTKVAPLSSSGSAVQANAAGAMYLGMGDIAGQTNHTTLIAGCRYRTPPGGTAASFSVLSFLDVTAGGGTTNFGVGFNNTSLRFFVYRNSTATVVATGTTPISLGAIYQIELKTTFATTAVGSYEFRINGIAELSGVANTQTAVTNAYSQYVWIGNTAGSTNQQWDDLYLCDDTGSAPNNTFLASSTTPIRVETVFPNSTVSTAFTPLSSTNLSNIQETAMDSDTTYNSSSASGNVDLFGHAALSSTPITIFGARVETTARKDDVTNQVARTKLVSGSTTSNGASNTMQTLYTSPNDLYANDPNTPGGTGAWTASTVNSTSIGYEHV